MKRPALRSQPEEDETSIDDRMKEAMIEAISANDKVIEIRPADQSKGGGLKKLLLVGACAAGVAYLIRNYRKPSDLIESAKRETSDQVNQAAETMETGSDSVSDRIEVGSERASEAVQGASQKAAERTEDLGEEAAERTEEFGEEAAERMEEAGEEMDDEGDSGPMT